MRVEQKMWKRDMYKSNIGKGGKIIRSDGILLALK